MKRWKVVTTANFQRNLDGLESFRPEHPEAFLRALQGLRREVLPLLRQQPGVGRPFDRGQLVLRPIVERVRGRLGGVLREYLVGEYLVLYLVGPRHLTLMAMRHQRELGYDFGD